MSTPAMLLNVEVQPRKIGLAHSPQAPPFPLPADTYNRSGEMDPESTRLNDKRRLFSEAEIWVSEGSVASNEHSKHRETLVVIDIASEESRKQIVRECILAEQEPAGSYLCIPERPFIMRP
ncbi:hypothetical protein JMJ77_0008323 [Colletotrichum scovillei]|uniref:Uncharacterized protein n=1 Tax=Colletotrichum scovillei TaxID=1209932 RepID=A0A9P7RGA4_9PEZI|nr:hypothetical protein JMJ77_0008323 [Colletotrichum scovillei]KAG7075352.1 hypothetical protein JMJ76_0011812 [Colletotrichum scovillei]KAG7082560.1 hypothetical protein JMJ78_0004661 [Colletotrichum scovillei]